jgi:uncharacterized membrane protein
MEKKRKEKILSFLGALFIIMGILVFTVGKPDPLDPNIIDPTWQTIAAGLFLIMIGFLIYRKHFKAYLDENLE